MNYWLAHSHYTLNIKDLLKFYSAHVVQNLFGMRSRETEARATLEQRVAGKPATKIPTPRFSIRRPYALQFTDQKTYEHVNIAFHRDQHWKNHQLSSLESASLLTTLVVIAIQ